MEKSPESPTEAANQIITSQRLSSFHYRFLASHLWATTDRAVRALYVIPFFGTLTFVLAPCSPQRVLEVVR